ncbi:MAG: hypothetical protein RLZZ301_1263 [Bacteroidota bacterium]|jgi:ring-1,2-phenylacetyl-CoA epoxidase subunit PaaE
MSTHFHTLKVKDIQKETEDCVSVLLDVPKALQEAFQYKAGQYLTFKHPEQPEIRRSYSLSSAPSDNEWRVAIKAIPNGAFSQFANSQLKVGSTLEVMAPMGNFYFEPTPSATHHYLLVAAGSGITPILAIAKTILTQEPNSTVTLYFGNKGFLDIIYREELEHLKNRYLTRFNLVHLFSRESIGNSLQKGRIDQEKCTALNKVFLGQMKPASVFVCGPEALILGVKEAMIAWGLTAQQIHFELFHAAPPSKAASTEKTETPVFDSKVEVIMDGESVHFHLSSDGKTILDAAYEAGADAPFACKGGVCCTCKAKVLRGKVSMDINYALTPEEVENGYVLTCQAHPQSDDVLVSFDD